MELRRIGRSGLWVSVLGLGCNNFGPRTDQDRATEVVKAALDAGVTFFDTANIYGSGRSEEYLGRALAGHSRDEVVIATKFGMQMAPGPYGRGGSRKHMVAECERSLRRLGTEFIDLYYLHAPDPATPIAETLDALDDLVRAGKVRYVACSNFAGWQIADAEHTARARGTSRFIACQSEWSLVRREVEAEVVPACEAFGLGVVPFFPLAAGLLTGKYTRGEPPPEGTRMASSPYMADMATDAVYDTIDRLAAVAAASGRSLLELAIGWLAAQPSVPSVLVGATRPAQVAANAAAAGVALSPDELQAVSAAAPPA